MLHCRTTPFSGLPLVMDNWTVTAAAADAAGVLGSAWDSPHYDNTSFCTRSSAFFTAPTPGAYTFWVAADDYARLCITFNNVSVHRPFYRHSCEARHEASPGRITTDRNHNCASLTVPTATGHKLAHGCTLYGQT